MRVDCYRIVFAGRPPARGGGACGRGFGVLLGALLGALLWAAVPSAHAQEPSTGNEPLDATAPATWVGGREGSVIGGCGGAGQVGKGFVVSAGLGGRLAALPVLTTPPSPMTMMGMTTPTTTPTSSATAADTSAGPKWNLFLGYKLCRVVVGLNLDLLVYSPVGSSNTVTSFLLAPEVQVALARSRDSRAELLGMVNIGLGQTAGFFQIGGTLAPGVRYWVHRHIALSTLLGLQASLTVQGKAGQTVLLSLLGTAGVLGAF